MVNLEFYKDEINGFIKEKSFGSVSCAIKYGFEEFAIKYIENYKNRPCEFVDWLLEEHKEPIKLTKFEYDLLKCYQETKDDGEFVDHYILKEMQYKGYFQNVDYNLTIEEILDNCEVIEK